MFKLLTVVPALALADQDVLLQTRNAPAMAGVGFDDEHKKHHGEHEHKNHDDEHEHDHPHQGGSHGPVEMNEEFSVHDDFMQLCGWHADQHKFDMYHCDDAFMFCSPKCDDVFECLEECATEFVTDALNAQLEDSADGLYDENSGDEHFQEEMKEVHQHDEDLYHEEVEEVETMGDSHYDEVFEDEEEHFDATLAGDFQEYEEHHCAATCKPCDKFWNEFDWENHDWEENQHVGRNECRACDSCHDPCYDKCEAVYFDGVEWENSECEKCNEAQWAMWDQEFAGEGNAAGGALLQHKAKKMQMQRPKATAAKKAKARKAAKKVVKKN